MTVRQLSGGDILAGSHAEVYRVVTNGVYERNPDDSRSKRLWPKGKIELLIRYPGEDAPSVRYWNARTTVTLSDRKIGDA